MKRLSCIIYLLLFFFAVPVLAQKKVVLEKIRTYGLNRLAAYYWQNKEIKKTIASQLNQLLQEHQAMVLTDTASLNVEFLSFDNGVPAITPVFDDKDTSHLHLYIDFLEIDPAYFFLNSEYTQLDSNLIKRTKTVFQLHVLLLKENRTIVSYETLNIVVSMAATPGMGSIYGDGISFNNLAVLPNVFIGLIRSSANIIFNPKNELAMVEIKLQPAFLTDNYILPKTANLPRTFVSTTKGIGSYTRANQTEMIRFSEPVYEEIKIKGKKAEKYPEEITKAIKSSKNFRISDFVFLGQNYRDVGRDKNYYLQLTTQIDPSNLPQSETLLFTNFLSNNFHYLFQERDTLAKFSIRKDIPDNENKVYANILYNGYDSASVYKINHNAKEFPINYGYVLAGVIGHQSFTIKCSGYRNMVKEFFFNNKLVCIAQGKFSPEKFVVFGATLSSGLLNQLFIIGFNRFLE